MKTGAHITIRTALPGDASAFDDIAGKQQPDGWSSLDAPRSRSLLAVASDDAPIGFVEAQRAGDDVEIIMIITRPTARRSGVATRLLTQLLAEAEAGGAARVILDVAEDNTAARGLYDNAGFKEISRRAGYYRGSTTSTAQTGRRDALLLARHFASGTVEL